MTGNAVFAMGMEGVLIRTPDGAYSWAAVGDALRVDLRRSKGLLSILQGKLALAAGFGLLGILTLLGRWRRSVARKIALGLYGLLWGALVVTLPQLKVAPLRGSASTADMLLVLGGCAGLLIHVLVELALMLPKQAKVREVARVALAGPAGAVAFFLPYVLWVLGVIPWYGLAMGLGITAGVGVVVGGWKWMGRRGPAQAARDGAEGGVAAQVG